MKAKSIPVSKIVAAWLAAVIVLVAGSVAFLASGGGTSTDTVGASTYSRSAIGYAGFADVMRRLGARVIKSRRESAAKVDPEGVLIVAEPAQSVTPQQMSTLLNSKTVLLILPKWRAAPSARRPEWAGVVEPLPSSVARAATQVADVTVVREPKVTRWTVNEVGVDPVFSQQVQLIKSTRLRPVVAADAGMLVGEMRIGNRSLFILADPDVMSNYGIAEPDNAAFAVALINKLRGTNGNLVFDEVIHGFEERTDSPFKLLFEFPFVLVTIWGAAAVGLLLWATMRRFGAPASLPATLAAGKRSLIETTANIWDVPRHRPLIVQRYVHAIIHDVGRELHAPGGVSDAELVGWLKRSARVREAGLDCAALLGRADALRDGSRTNAGAMTALARDIFRWKREVLDGGPRYSGHDRGDSPRNRQGSRRAG